jgi:hypothetical protein
MMTRSQRIEYEILDCAINGAGRGRAYTTTVATFIERLRDLFPDIDPQEFTDASIRLVNLKALQVNGFDRSTDGPPDYPVLPESIPLRYSNSRLQITLHAAVKAQQYFKELAALIEIPSVRIRRGS